MQCLKLNNCSHWPSPISRASVLPELHVQEKTNQIQGKGFIQNSCVLISERIGHYKSHREGWEGKAEAQSPRIVSCLKGLNGRLEYWPQEARCVYLPHYVQRDWLAVREHSTTSWHSNMMQ